MSENSSDSVCETECEAIGRALSQAVRDDLYPWQRSERDRHLRHLTVFGATIGAWGAVNGFALFFFVEQNLDQPLAKIILPVVVATLAAFVVEWLATHVRIPVRRLEEETSIEGLRSKSSDRLFYIGSWPAFFSLATTLLVFQVFSSATSELVKDSETWSASVAWILGVDSTRATWNLVSFILIWIVLGAALGGIFGRAVVRTADDLVGRARLRLTENNHKAWLFHGLATALKAGIIYVPLVMFATGLLMRLSWGVWMFLTAGSWPFPRDDLWHYVLPLGFLGWLALGLRDRKSLTAGSVLFAVLVTLRMMFAAGAWTQTITTLFSIAFRAILLWSVPAVVLGVFLAIARRPDEFSRLWSWIAFVIAMICVPVAVVQGLPWLIIAAVLLLVAGFIFQRAKQIEEYWPLLGAAAAVALFLTTNLTQQLSSLGIYTSIQTTINPPVRPNYDYYLMRDSYWYLIDDVPVTRPAQRIPNEIKEHYFQIKKEVDQIETNPRSIGRILCWADLLEHPRKLWHPRAVSSESVMGQGYDRPLGSLAADEVERALKGENSSDPPTAPPVEEPKAVHDPNYEAYLSAMRRYIEKQILFDGAMLGYEPSSLNGNTIAWEDVVCWAERQSDKKQDQRPTFRRFRRPHRFEFAMLASITFWISIGLLKMWSIQRSHQRRLG